MTLLTTDPNRQALPRTVTPFLDRFLFLAAWLRRPRSIAAVAPSGRALARLITREIDAGTGRVLELGPGTGVFTQALLARGIDERNLTLIEYDAGFASLLARRFPQARVLNTDAADIASLPISVRRPFGAIVCGLGLLNMEADQVQRILDAAFARLRPGGSLYLFTYGWRCSVPAEVLGQLGLVATRVGTAWRNIPPASVYQLTLSGES